MVIRFTPKGLAVERPGARRSPAPRQFGGSIAPQAMTPKAPALEMRGHEVSLD
jgi:hypothetical protein